MDPILEMFRASLLADPDVRSVTARAFSEALTKALATAPPDVLGDLFIAVGESLKTPGPPTP